MSRWGGNGETAGYAHVTLGVVRAVEDEPGLGVFFAVEVGAEPARPGVVWVPNPAVYG